MKMGYAQISTREPHLNTQVIVIAAEKRRLIADKIISAAPNLDNATALPHFHTHSAHNPRTTTQELLLKIPPMTIGHSDFDHHMQLQLYRITTKHRQYFQFILDYTDC